MRTYRLPVVARANLGWRGVLLLSLAGGLALLTSGCLRLTARSDPTRYFVLAALPADLPTNAPLPHLSLVVRRVHVPAYLDKRWIATRDGNELRYAVDDEWAESLQDGIQRVLVANLTVLLRSSGIAMSTAVAGLERYELIVDIQRFEVSANGEALLVARWDLLGPDRPTPLRSGQFQKTDRNPAAGHRPELMVQLQSALLIEFSRDLAGALATLSSAPPGGTKGAARPEVR